MSDNARSATVLLIEDGEVDAVLVKKMLAKAQTIAVEVVRCDRLECGLTRLRAGSIDLVLLDLTLPDSEGIDTFEQVHVTAPDVPIIVMSAHDDEALAVNAVRLGAQDYLIKGQVTVGLLSRAVHYALERQRLLALLRGQSLLDELTGLHNRRGFLTLAASHLRVAQRTGRPFTLLYGDLDGLKEINDTFGHKEGDAAIMQAADLLRSSFRMSDVVARLGGDEFVVLAIDAGTEAEPMLLARMQSHFDEFNANSGLRYRISLSMGVASYPADSPLTLDQMLDEADRALYVRKRGKRSSAGVKAAG